MRAAIADGIVLRSRNAKSLGSALQGKADSVTQSRNRWAFLVAEALLIVVSILLAFAIDAWYDGRQEDGRRLELLQALRADLTATSGDLDIAIEQGGALVDRTGGFLRAVRSEEEIGIDSLTSLFGGVGDVPFFEPTLPSYRTAVSTGTIELVRSPALVAALADFEFAQGLYQLHLGVSADLYYLGPLQDLRRAGATFDDPIASTLGTWVQLPPTIDLRGTLASSAAEPMYTVQRNMVENLQDMRGAAARAITELDSLLAG